MSFCQPQHSMQQHIAPDEDIIPGCEFFGIVADSVLGR